MSLMDAPKYDPKSDNLKRNLIIAGMTAVTLLVVLTLAGFILGHGWLFSDLRAEHRADQFFTALEAKDYTKAYDLYNGNKPNPTYSLQRFTEDWTTYSPAKAPITSHHVDVSRGDGKGTFGSVVIIGVTLNGTRKVFINYIRADQTFSCCSVTKEIQYN